MQLLAVALVAVAVTVPDGAARADETAERGGDEPAWARGLLGYGLRLEAGAEHDSNPARLETVAGAPPRPIVASPALRLVTAADLTAGLGRGHFLSLSGGLAGKRFLQTDARPEDLLIADARLALQLRLGGSWGLAVDAAYYDVFQRARLPEDARDFRSAAPSLRLERAFGAWAVSLGGGWRWFTFKSQGAYDFQAPTARAAARYHLPGSAGDGDATPADWSISAGAAVELRHYAVTRCLSPDVCPAPAGFGRREDRFWSGEIDIARTGVRLLGIGLGFGMNDSNSYGESLWRAGLSARVVWLLPWQLALAARGELVATRYREAVPVGHDAMTGAYLSVEEEGRSTLRLELVRPLGPRLELGARYTLYLQGPGAGPVEFRRQIVLGYVAFLGPGL